MSNWNKGAKESSAASSTQGLANTINTESDVVAVDAQVEGTVKPEASDAKSAGSGAKAKIMKAAGVKSDDVLAWNAESSTLVSAQGGKYRMAADGKEVLHLAGPLLKDSE